MKTQTLASTLGDRARSGPRIGLIALEADATIEDEWRELLAPERVGFNTARIPCDTEINPTTLAHTGERLAHTAGTILPGAPLDALAFACTSATLVLGEEYVERTLHAARPGPPVTTPLTAVKAALRTVDARRIALLTPYVDEINLPLAEHLTRAGHEVVALGSFFRGDDNDVARISADSIRAGVEALIGPPARRPDAVLIACTGLRAAGLVPELEARYDRPVTTSNHAMAWHALELCDARDVRAPDSGQRGRLYARRLTT